MTRKAVTTTLRIFCGTILTVLTLASCTSGIYGRMYVESDVPVPIMDPVPLKIGVVYPDDMNDYVGEVRPQSDESFEIGVRDSQKVVLNKVFRGVFTSVEVLDSMTSGTDDLDLIIRPSLDDFSLLTARDSGGDFFAVSMRHWLDVHTPQGQKVNRIVVNSYGRQRKGGEMGSNEDSIYAAVNSAFRDMAVNAIVGLSSTFKEKNLDTENQADQ